MREERGLRRGGGRGRRVQKKREGGKRVEKQSRKEEGGQ